MDKWRSPRGQYILALGISSLVSLGLFSYGAWRHHGLAAAYLPWNLLLAWLPLIFALRLMSVLKRKLWSSWEALAVSLLWVAFLPNSFYLISDLIHLQELPQADILYDAVMFASFVFTGAILGFSSLYLVHWRLRRRLYGWQSTAWVGAILLLCSAAIYMGRDLRWNTWDIVFNPAGLLFEISDRLQHIASYPHMLLVIAAFFALLASLYNMVWHGSRLFMPHLNTSTTVKRGRAGATNT
jgi:uncharacterized membrane protein